MFKKILCFLLILCIILGTILPAFAMSASGSGSGGGGYGSGSPGGSSGGVGGGGGAAAMPVTSESDDGEDAEEGDDGAGIVIIINCDCPKLDPYTTYTPKVTSIHNLNALLSQTKLEENGSSSSSEESESYQNVYYIPTMDELPFDLTAFIKGLGARGENESAVGKFALVYDGFFDSEAKLVVPYKSQLEKPTGSGYKIEAHTSKSVMTQYNDKALQTIGYDLLLSREKIKIKDGGGQWNFEYVAKQCGNKTLTAQVAIMDLYKAMGVFEYDVNFAIGIDPDFEANTSPILQELGFITSQDMDNGLDASEGKTYVGVTRTNPDLYWDRYLKDGINLGVTALDRNDLSTIYHLNAAVQKDTHVNMLQFCNLATAIMNLYGESAISPEEETQFDRTCSKYLLDVPEASDVELDSLKYLVIKGIIKAEDLGKVDWNAGVHLSTDFDQDVPNNYILGMLGRIADPDSRFELPEIEDIKSDLADSGYYRTNVTIANSSNVVEVSTNSRFSYDYLIEVNNSTAQFVMPVESVATLDDDEDTVTAEIETDSDNENIVQGDLQASSIAIADVITSGANLRYDADQKPYTLDLGDVQLGDSSTMKRGSSPDTLDSWAKHEKGIEPSANEVGKYYYYGVENYDGRYFYHFKLNRKAVDNLSGCKLQFGVNQKFYRPVSADAAMNNAVNEAMEGTMDDVSVTVSKSQDGTEFDLSILPELESGGVFYADEDGSWVRKTFAEEGFSEEFVDDNTLVASPTANEDYKTLLFYIKEPKKVRDGSTDIYNKLINLDRGEVNWSEIFTNSTDNTFKNKSVVLQNSSGKFLSVFATMGGSTKVGSRKIYRFEIVTDDVDYVKGLELFKNTNASRNQSDQVLDGFFRVNNGEDGGTSLLVSVDYLLENKLINSFTKVKDGIYLLTSTEYENNVIINVPRRLIIVGNTIYSVQSEDNADSDDVDGVGESEILYTTDHGKQYVSYRACLGWADNFSVIADNGTDAVMATAPDQYGLSMSGTDKDISYDTISVNTYLPQSYTNTMTVKIDAYSGDDAVQVEGVALTGTYALAPYYVVHSDNYETNDFLFVWHFADCKGYNEEEYKIKQKVSTDAIAHFKLLTGIQLEKQRGYRLVEYKLRKDECLNEKGTKNNVSGMQYVRLVNNKKSAYASWRNATIGWVYTPPEFKVRDAIDAYADSGTKDELKDAKLPLPIFKYKGKDNTYGDADVNMCSEDKSSDKFTLGCLPCTFDANQKNGLVTVKQDGSRAKAGKQLSDTAWKKDTSDYTIWTAPVALFAQIKGLGYDDVDKLDNVTVYYGTSKCEVKDGELSIAGTTSKIDTKAEAVVAYQGSSNNSVYVVSENVKFVDELLEKLDTTIEYILSDPSALIDWEAYSFGRLVTSLDNISSVVLLFILSVLPRIATLLFLILILLSTIVEVKPWRSFCNQWFDVYSLLTLGHQTVETINTKRMVIISCWALALFIMIQDGALFNFIIWVARGLVSLYQ